MEVGSINLGGGGNPRRRFVGLIIADVAPDDKGGSRVSAARFSVGVIQDESVLRVGGDRRGCSEKNGLPRRSIVALRRWSGVIGAIFSLLVSRAPLETWEKTCRLPQFAYYALECSAFNIAEYIARKMLCSITGRCADSLQLRHRRRDFCP